MRKRTLIGNFLLLFFLIISSSYGESIILGITYSFSFGAFTSGLISEDIAVQCLRHKGYNEEGRAYCKKSASTFWLKLHFYPSTASTSSKKETLPLLKQIRDEAIEYLASNQEDQELSPLLEEGIVWFKEYIAKVTNKENADRLSVLECIEDLASMEFVIERGFEF